MTVSPPLTELDINLADSGFYKGFNNIVALASKILTRVQVLSATVKVSFEL